MLKIQEISIYLQIKKESILKMNIDMEKFQGIREIMPVDF
jgi:hypothetical protein